MIFLLLVPLAWCPFIVSEHTILRMVLICAGAAWLCVKAKDRPMTPGGWCLLALLALASVSAIYNGAGLIGRWNSYDHGLIAMAIFVAIYRYSHGEVFKPMVLCACVLSLVGLAQWAPIPTKILPFIGRTSSLIGSPVHLGTFLAICLPLSVEFARRDRRWYFSVALIFACIISTLSRGALLASAFSVAVYFCLEIPKSRRSIVLSSAFVACLCLLHIAKRDTAQSDIGRSEAWRVALIEIKRHPLLGVGPDNMEHSYRKEMTPSFDQESWGTTSHANAHNDWLQIGATLGIPALLLYLAAQFLVVIRLLWLGRFAEVAALSAAFIAAKFNPMTICGILYCAILAGREHD